MIIAFFVNYWLLGHKFYHICFVIFTKLHINQIQGFHVETVSLKIHLSFHKTIYYSNIQKSLETYY